jgi:hypothetical protein
MKAFTQYNEHALKLSSENQKKDDITHNLIFSHALSVIPSHPQVLKITKLPTKESN